MKITIFGSGYVGLVTGACLAELGNKLTIVDVNKTKINQLNNGFVPIYEKGLKELILKNENNITFTTEIKDSIKNSDIIFIAVGTPDLGNGKTNLTYIKEVAKSIGEYINDYKIIVTKSTVPVGTNDLIFKTIYDNCIRKRKKIIKFNVVSNPEFLREGNAIRDFLNPDRIVIGSDSENAITVMKKLYSSLVRIDRPIFVTDIKSAELIKYASNSLLACKISFMNQLSHLCDKVGANIKDVANGVGLDHRISPRFLQAGIGYGGSCFPKDVKSLANTLKEYNCNNELISAIDNVNELQKTYFVNDIKSKNVAILGLAFKPNTDDIREAPSIKIIKILLKNFCKINVCDPKAMENIKNIFGDKINYYKDFYECVKDCDYLLLLTEWDIFRNPCWNKIKENMKGNLIFDGRNIYDKNELIELGFEYKGVGR